MLKGNYGDSLPSSNWVRLCDACKVAASTLYCHTHSAYLCSACDGSIHAMGSPCWLHHRVRVCGACENAPAAFTCKADAASLCINCDYEIHSANPIASRHNRVPVSPLSHHSENETLTASTDELPNLSVLDKGNEIVDYKSSIEMDEMEADSWLLLDSDTKDSQVGDDGFKFGTEAADENLGAVECDSSTKFEDEYNRQQPSCFSDEINENDSVVPIHSVESQAQLHRQQQHNIYFNMEHEPSRVVFTNHPSSCPTVPMSFMDAHAVQLATMSDISSYSFPFGVEIFPNHSVSMHMLFGEMNRKAGVLKYREKKKSRKFEKRIRYAYRKAYAEKRPRLKGRFARREDIASEGPVTHN